MREPRLLRRRSPSTGRWLAYAKFDGRTVSFGACGPEAQRAFDTFKAEWLRNGRRLPDDPDDAETTVADLVADFLEHGERVYVPREVVNLRAALAPVLERFGALPVRQFDVTCLEIVQRQLAEARLARSTIKSRMNAIRRCWRWGESRRLCPAGSWEHLRTLEHLKPGRTPARETQPVDAVPWKWVEPILPHLSQPLAAAVLVQWHAGLRPGEILTMTRRQLDTSGKIWIYRPTHHKGTWRGRERIIRLGPKAQEALRPLLKLDANAPIISPRDAIAEQKQRKRAARRTRPTKQMRERDARAAAAGPAVAEAYDVNTYRRAIHRACDDADVPRWGPHRLRHACAARLFSAGEFEAARAVLGHSRMDMTRHYAAAADAKLAGDAMLRHG